MSVEEAVITFPIKFLAEGENTDEVAASTSSGLPDVDEETMGALLDFVKTTDKQGLQTLSKLAKNPSGMVQNEFLSMLGKAGIHGAIATAIISAILASPQVMITLTRALAVKGGPLNQDFHRFFEDEGQQGIARDLQYRRAAGFDVVITNEDRGFLLLDPFAVGNSLIDIDTTRAQRLSSNNTKYGYKAGM